MKEIELYDIITLSNGAEYTILEMLKHEEKNYYLLAPVDENEEPNMEKIKIVEENRIGNKITITENIDENLCKYLAKQFLSSMKELVDEL